MTQLQKLAIKGCLKLLLPEAASVNSRVSTLLAVVGELTLLLELKLVLDVDEDEVEAVPSAAFAALTASSQLHVLNVELSHDAEVAFPGPDVLQQMFPAGRLLRQLHTLVLGSADVDYYCSEWSVPSADLARVAASCSALQTLSLVDVFVPGSQSSLQPLLDLTMLSSLRVGGAAWDDSAAGVVAQLTQLTSLEWVHTHDDPDRCGMSQAGLLRLAALEQLHCLSIRAADVLDENARLEDELGSLPIELASSDEVCWQVHLLHGASQNQCCFWCMS
jgi:hypothetical protein